MISPLLLRQASPGPPPCCSQWLDTPSRGRHCALSASLCCSCCFYWFAAFGSCWIPTAACRRRRGQTTRRVWTEGSLTMRWSEGAGVCQRLGLEHLEVPNKQFSVPTSAPNNRLLQIFVVCCSLSTDNIVLTTAKKMWTAPTERSSWTRWLEQKQSTRSPSWTQMSRMWNCRSWSDWYLLGKDSEQWSQCCIYQVISKLRHVCLYKSQS